MCRERLKYLDSLKFIAIFIVFTMHFINKYGDTYRHLFHDMPTSIALYGISGKMGVAILAVIMGLLAYYTKRDIGKAIVHRYLFFFISVIAIDLGYVVYNYMALDTRPDMLTFFRAGICLEDLYFPALWFIKDFFIGYVIIVLNSRSNVKVWGVLLEIAVFIMFSEIWIAICLLGNVVALLLNDGFVLRALKTRRVIRLVLCIIAYGITKVPVETNLGYMAYGIATVLIILVINSSDLMNSLLSINWFAFLGRYSWGFFLVHALIYHIVGRYIFNMEMYTNQNGYVIRFILCFLTCLVCNIVVSVPLTKTINWVSNKLEKFLEQVSNVFKTYLWESGE